MGIEELVKEKLNKLQLELDTLKNELKKQKYPIYCKLISNAKVVKFIGLKEGTVVKNSKFCNIGHYSKDWIEHTDTDRWEQLEVCPETGFFDGQAVWCWDNHYTHRRTVSFYNPRTKRTYNYLGKKDSASYDNYEPFEGNYAEWMLKAFETLER